MRITRRQLRRIIREALDPQGMADFDNRFDRAYRMPSGRYRGQPDEPMPGDRDGIPVKVDMLGKELYAAYQAGDAQAIAEIEAELKTFGEVGTDEIYYRSPEGKNQAKSEWDY